MKNSSMEAGPSSESVGKGEERTRGRQKPGQWPLKIEPFVPNTDHNPKELKSWAKRTGFNPNLSGEALSSVGERSGVLAAVPETDGGLDLEKGLGRRGNGLPPNSDFEPMLGRRRAGVERRGVEINPVPGSGTGVARIDSDAEDLGVRRVEKEKRRIGVEPEVVLKEQRRVVGDEPNLRDKNDRLNGNGHGDGVPVVAPGNSDGDSKKDVGRGEREVDFDLFSDSQEPENPSGYKSTGLRCGLTENLGLG